MWTVTLAITVITVKITVEVIPIRIEKKKFVYEKTKK